MRRIVHLLAAMSALGLATSALAALPTSGDFTGKTSVHSLNGFYDLVTFVSAKGGRRLTQFQFGTLGCEGSGDYPIGVDPYALDNTEATVASVPVAANGLIDLTTKPTIAETNNIVTTATIKATFANSKSVNGTIAVRQSVNGTSCGPVTMKFSAVPGTPESLGYAGP